MVQSSEGLTHIEETLVQSLGLVRTPAAFGTWVNGSGARDIQCISKQQHEEITRDCASLCDDVSSDPCTPSECRRFSGRFQILNMIGNPEEVAYERKEAQRVPPTPAGVYELEDEE